MARALLVDDLGGSVGKSIGGLGGCSFAALSLVLTGVLLVAVGGVALGADSATIETVKGQKYRMADAVMADSITRYIDPTGDQLSRDGSPATDAPEWSDIKSVYLAGTRTPAKLRTKMQSDHPPGASDSFYGSIARPHAKDRIVFVAVQMAKGYPANARGQVVEVGIAGDAATPVQVTTDADMLAGLERFSLSGLFRNGALATGDTDIVGRQPGAEVADADYYNVDSGVFGFYDSKRATWYVVVPRAGDTDVITVSVHSTTGSGQVVDRLDLPDGGHFIDLVDPLGGFKAKAGLPRLSCRALETYSGTSGLVELSSADATLVRYTVGVDESVASKKAAELLAPAIAAAGPVEVALTPVASQAEPLTVEGQVDVAATGDTVTLTFEAPEGQWTFALAEGSELITPAGEAIMDHSSLTGPAGVRTGAGLDGFVAGDRSCLEVDGQATDASADGPAESADPTGSAEPAGSEEPAA
jgi:hypothetical protein